MTTTNHTSPIGEDAANGAIGEREAFELKDFEASLWGLVEQARSWEKKYRDSAVLYEDLDNYKNNVESELRHLVNLFRTQLEREASILRQFRAHAALTAEKASLTDMQRDALNYAIHELDAQGQGLYVDALRALTTEKVAAEPVAVRTHTTQPGESVMGIALRQCGNEAEWRHILACNPKFADLLPNDYFPVGTVLTLPAAAQPVSGGNSADQA